jgi:hypothetical protein
LEIKKFFGNWKFVIGNCDLQYYIIAKKAQRGETEEGKPQVNDYYCYYGGNPVIVQKDELTFVGLNCSQKKNYLSYEKTKDEKESGIIGKAAYKNQPFEGVYVLVFDNAEKNFRGSFSSISAPTDKDGNFILSLPPGKYYIIAKKLLTAGEPYIHPYGRGKIIEKVSLTAGPPKQGDFYSYYDQNPIEVKENYYTRIELSCVPKIGADDKTFYSINSDLAKTKVEGLVVDENNKPLSGVYVFLAKNRLLEGKPEYLSNSTKKDGKFTISVNEPGWYHMGARNYLGRPIQAGDMYGYYNDASNNLIEAKENTVITDIVIKLTLVK